MRVFALLAALAVVGVVVFAPVSGLYFHADDFDWLSAARDAALISPSRLPDDVNGHFRPLAEALWLVEYRNFGLESRGFHIVAVTLHLLVAAVVGGVAWRLLGEAAGGFVAALLFAVNFSHREVPSWISAAPDLLLGLGTALALLGFLGRGRWRWLGVVGFSVALLAKESALILVFLVPLLAPEVVRRGAVRWVLALVVAALAVPHLLAFVLSSYARSRFDVGAMAGATFLEALSALFLPMLGAELAARSDWGWLVEPHSAPRVAIGSGVFAGVAALATQRLGWRRTLAWATGVLLTLVLPSLSTAGLESRWLYAPWVVLAPLAAAAVLGLRDRLATARGRRAGLALVALVLAGHLITHGLAMRAKLARDVARDSWVRGIIEGALRSPPALREGQPVEVIVPFGSELRSWPVGLRLALATEIEVRPIDHLTEPTPGVTVLDTTVRPARWR